MALMSQWRDSPSSTRLGLLVIQALTALFGGQYQILTLAVFSMNRKHLASDAPPITSKKSHAEGHHLSASTFSHERFKGRARSSQPDVRDAKYKK